MCDFTRILGLGLGLGMALAFVVMLWLESSDAFGELDEDETRKRFESRSENNASTHAELQKETR